MKKFTVVIASLVLVGSARADLAPRTLDDIFHAAIKRSEAVANQEEAVFQAQETHTQAIGSILPNLSGAASYYRETQPTTAGLPTTLQKQTKLTATQPLFLAAAYPALKETELTVQSQQQAAKQSRITLFQSVVTSFYQVLAAERDIVDLQRESKMYTEWVKFLQGWVNIGRARPSDVTQIQSQLYTLYATLEGSELTLVQARQTLAFLTGLAPDTQLQDPYPEVYNPPVDGLDTYTKKIEDRPDVKTFAYARDSADYGIDAAKAGHLPTVNLLGDYYMTSSGTTAQGGAWDFQLTLTLPIYTGGVTQSKVRQAASQYRQGELNLSQNERQAEEQIRTYFDQVRLDHEQVATLEKAKGYAWTNYQQETHDYRLGLVTNIDVLTSMTTFETNERAFDKERFQEKTDYLYLQSLAGKVKDAAISF